MYGMIQNCLKYSYMKKQLLIILLIVTILFFRNYSHSYAALSSQSVPTSPLNQRDKYQTNLFSGSAEYSYSVPVPKGTNNLTPDVSLSYDHQSTHSLPMYLGNGWEVNTDYISRDVNFTPGNTGDD